MKCQENQEVNKGKQKKLPGPKLGTRIFIDIAIFRNIFRNFNSPNYLNLSHRYSLGKNSE